MRLATYRAADGPRLGLVVGVAGEELVLDAARLDVRAASIEGIGTLENRCRVDPG